VPPGKYKAKLTVDGVSETQEFEVFMNPKENYTQAEADAKYAFWMELYTSTESWTQSVIKALQVKDDVAAKFEAYKESGASASKINKAEKQAEIVYGIVDSYEGTYVSTGRTLAEVINLPATILFKMSFMSGILEHSVGSLTRNIYEVYQSLVEESKVTDAKYNSSIEADLTKFNKNIK
jgi:hypothetical protein